MERQRPLAPVNSASLPSSVNSHATVRSSADAMWGRALEEYALWLVEYARETGGIRLANAT